MSARLAINLQFTDAPVQVSDIFDLIVSFKFLKFNSQVFLLYVPEMSAISHLTLFRLSTCAWVWIL